MEDARRFSEPCAFQISRYRQQTVFAQQRFELVERADERDEIECRHGALQKQSHKPYITDVRFHSYYLKEAIGTPRNR